MNEDGSLLTSITDVPLSSLHDHNGDSVELKKGFLGRICGLEPTFTGLKFSKSQCISTKTRPWKATSRLV